MKPWSRARLRNFPLRATGVQAAEAGRVGALPGNHGGGAVQPPPIWRRKRELERGAGQSGKGAGQGGLGRGKREGGA